MSVVYAMAMGALALAVPVAWLGPPLVRERAGSCCSTAGCLLLVIAGLEAALGSSEPVVNLGSWIGFGHSSLRADGLAGIFLTLTGITGAAVSLAHLELPAGRWLTTLSSLLLLLIAVAIGSDNGFLFFLAWEAITVCVYLIASAGGGRDLIAGYLTGALAKLGGAALLAALALLYAHTHSFSLDAWRHAHLAAGTRDLLFALFLTCFATKVGVLPLQGGLPAGYGSAPRLGAASLSVALCAGFYGLWRFEFDVLGPLPAGCGDALLIIAALTAVTGITYALTQDDLRRFLGYSTVEHAGIALTGFAVALLGHAAHQPRLAAAGLLACTLHVCAHNLAKALALIGIDRVSIATGGERTLDPLGGLSRALPFTATTLGLASLTLAAIPPLGGFVSEWFTFQALLQGFRMPTLLSQLLCALAGATLALTAGLGLLAFAKYLSFSFLGRARTARALLREPSRHPVGAGGLVIVLLFLGAAAPWEIHAIGSGLRPLLGFNLATDTISHPLVLGPVFRDFSVLDPTWLCIVLPCYALLGALIAFAGNRRHTARRAPVWVTGSGADLAAVQYRPSAYSNPMRVILRGPLGFRSRLVPAALGATAAQQLLETRVVLAVDRFLYQPVTAISLRIAGLVRATQSGHLSTYLLYMLLALLIALSLVPILH